jgi:two-component system sensor histidine kinase TctE
MWSIRRRRLRSLKSRLALWVVLPTVALMAVDVVLIYRSAEDTATLVQQQLLYGSAKIISERLAFVDGDYEISIPPAAFELFKSQYKDRVLFSVRASDGQLISGDDELAPYGGSLRIEEEKYFVSRLRGEAVRGIAFAHVLPNSSSGSFAITQVAQTLHGHDEFRDGLLRSTLRGHLVLLLLTIASLAMAFRWTIRPLIRFSETLRKRQSGSLEKLDENDAPSELGAVIDAMNDYVARLDHTLSSYEKFVADTAHHLRNAFAIIATQINFGKRAGGQSPEQAEVFNAIQKTLGNCTRVINQLLLLASIEQSKQEQEQALGDAIVLADVIAAVIDEMAPLAQQKEIELGVDDFDDSLRVAASVRLLQEVFANLIGNAIEHMQAPGTVSISLRRGAGSAVFSIVDDGPGIPEALQEKVFERFFRIDEAKPNSSGLGLAIVKEICELLAARVRLCTPPGGRGLQVDIEFPLAPDAAVSGARASTPGG